MLVYLRPETSSFWHTATNSTMTLPVDFPFGASSATLTIAGAFGYSQTIPDITASSVTVTLPEARMDGSSPATEDVYDITLEFNDGTVQTAKLGRNRPDGKAWPNLWAWRWARLYALSLARIGCCVGEGERTSRNPNSLRHDII